MSPPPAGRQPAAPSSCHPVARAARRIALLGAAAALAGCSALPSWTSLQNADSFLGLITPYRMDIVQGNVVTREQAAAVKPGMTRAQVRDILGSPMLTDMFHADRWDYSFTIRRPGTEPQRRSVVAFFRDDRLEKLEAPELPTEREFVASISRTSRSDKVPLLELSAEQKQALPVPARSAASAAAADEPRGAVREYPPLEPAS